MSSSITLGPNRVTLCLNVPVSRLSHPASNLRRGFVPRADGTEERTYGSAFTGGFDAAEWSQRVADHHGDVTEATRAWLVETGRAVEDAGI
ncbi:hypothetical protein ACIGXI_23000 [Kitasatospora aureofaciens]|uniref:hypothetical protein n=1 Tax=Kitasatospora aureofaciens TaxID=1894 RepID=UPI0037C6EDB4